MMGNMDFDTPELGESANEELADDVETLTRWLIGEANFEMPDPDPEDVDGMNPQMQMLSQQMDSSQIADIVLPHLHYLVASNPDEGLRVLGLIEEQCREIREHHE